MLVKSMGSLDEKNGKFEFVCLRNEDMQFVFNNFRIDLRDHNYAEIEPDFVSRTLVDKNFYRNINSLHFLIDGEAELYHDRKTKLTSGDVFLIGNNVKCSWRYTKPSKEITLLFNAYLGNLDDLFEGLRFPVILSGESKNIEEIKELFMKADHTSILKLRGMCSDYVLRFLELGGTDISHHIRITQKYAKVFDYITENLSIALHIDEIAKNTNYSVGFFTKSFVRDNKMTVKQYIHDKVMSEVEQRLITTDDSLSDIAEDYKFCECSYFTRWFKKHKGCTPSEYRKAMKSLAAR